MRLEEDTVPYYTLPKFNSSPLKSLPSQNKGKDRLPTIIFSGARAVKLGGGVSFSNTTYITTDTDATDVSAVYQNGWDTHPVFQKKGTLQES